MGNLRWIGVRRHSLIANTHPPIHLKSDGMGCLMEFLCSFACGRDLSLSASSYRREFVDTEDSIPQSSVVRSRSFDVDRRCASHDSLRCVWSSDSTGCLSS